MSPYSPLLYGDPGSGVSDASAPIEYPRIPTAGGLGKKSRVGAYAKRPSGETARPVIDGASTAGAVAAIDPSAATVSPRRPPAKRNVETARPPSGVKPSMITPPGSLEGNPNGEPASGASEPSAARAKPAIASGEVPYVGAYRFAAAAPPGHASTITVTAATEARRTRTGRA